MRIILGVFVFCLNGWNTVFHNISHPFPRACKPLVCLFHECHGEEQARDGYCWNTYANRAKSIRQQDQRLTGLESVTGHDLSKPKVETEEV